MASDGKAFRRVECEGRFEVKPERREILRKAPVILVILMALVLPLSASDAAAESLTEKQALEMLSAQIRKDRVYDSWATLDCLSFVTEKATRSYFDVGIREKHGGKCPGDPSTSPIVDRFRIDRRTRKIQWYDLQMELHAYGAFLKERAAKQK